MLLLNPLQEVKTLIFHLNFIIQGWNKNALSKKQCLFIALVVSAMALSGQLSWSFIGRASLGGVGTTALSWMLLRSKICWKELLQAAVYYLFQLYGVFEVHLVVDDSDRPRSKIVKALFGVFKSFDKKTGGYFQTQNIVFIMAVTRVFSFPIAFAFFRPDPAYSAWLREIKELKKKKVKRHKWPAEPIRDREKYPTRIELAAKLLCQIHEFFSSITILVNGKPTKIRVVTVTADAAYFSKVLKKQIHQLFEKAQFVSQLKKSQLCCNRRGIFKTLEDYFVHQKPVEAMIRLRGGEEKKVSFCSARLFIKSHGERVHVVALKYEGEDKYRYLAATNLTWRTLDIIRAYSLRWLIEVAIEDWKQYDGFGRKACQQGVDGACRGVYLSLLVDCFLLSHPHQFRLFKAGKSLCTAGSLVRSLQLENLFNTIKDIIIDPNPPKRLETLSHALAKSIFDLRSSSKHMQGRDIGEFEPSPSLCRREKRF